MTILQEEIILYVSILFMLESDWTKTCASNIKCRGFSIGHHGQFLWSSVCMSARIAVSISCRVRSLNSMWKKEGQMCLCWIWDFMIGGWCGCPDHDNQLDCHDLIDRWLCNCIFAIWASIVQCEEVSKIKWHIVKRRSSLHGTLEMLF